MMMHPGDIGPYESADRVWSGRWWPLYLVALFCVELHGGIGLYRLAVKWGWFVGGDANAGRKRLSILKWALTVFFIVLGLATLAAYMKIGYEHRARRRRALHALVGAARRATGSESMKIVYTDVLVIGGGLAGLRLAIGAKRRGHDAIILSLVPAKRSHSKAAQGGMQASLGNVIKGQGDNEDVHFEDTVRGSDWGADQEVVRMFVNTAPKAVRELAAWGVPWSRIRKGDRDVIINGQKVTITERDEAQGLIAQRDFGGTKKWRTCYAADGTGHAMITRGGRPRDRRVDPGARAHGGPGAHPRCRPLLWRRRARPRHRRAFRVRRQGHGDRNGRRGAPLPGDDERGDLRGHRARARARDRAAALGNMEAVQFHPTGIFPAGILVTEGCRGDGGLLKDADGHRFMPDYEPEKKELASRDVVSRRMEEHIKKGKGAKSRFGEHLWLDITQLGEKHIHTNLREVWDICHYFLGIDPTKDMIAVRPAQHYTMGGVRTNPTGESPTLKGLFAAGEAACWDMHGFNRLGGNSVAETVVAG